MLLVKNANVLIPSNSFFRRRDTSPTNGICLLNAKVRKNSLFCKPEHFKNNLLQGSFVSFRVTTTAGIYNFIACGKLADYICKMMSPEKRFDLVAAHSSSMTHYTTRGKKVITHAFMVRKILFRRKNNEGTERTHYENVAPFGDMSNSNYQWLRLLPEKDKITYKIRASTYGFATVRNPEQYVEVTKIAIK